LAKQNFTFTKITFLKFPDVANLYNFETFEEFDFLLAFPNEILKNIFNKKLCGLKNRGIVFSVI